MTTTKTVKPSIVFLGTGPVSLHCLEGIHLHFTIEAIITKPERLSPSGKRHDHPVRAWGEAHNIPVHQVADETELAELQGGTKLISHMGLVVDFGITIPAKVIDSFELGIINSHFSLLPLLRGPDPISFAILEGHSETGVSLMRIVPAMDEGDILSQERYTIPEGATTPELTEQLGGLSNRMLIRDLPLYVEGKLTPHPQNSAITPTYSRRLTKQDGIIDWSKPAKTLEREVRAFTPWPGSKTTLFDRDVTITATHTLVGKVGTDETTPPGSVVTPDGEDLVIASGQGALAIDRLKPAGKNEMTSADFLRGLPR